MADSDLNPFAILAALRFDRASAVTRISGGWDTIIWKIQRGDDAFTLRLFRVGETRYAAHETEMMRAASAVGIAVPNIHAEGSWNERPALVLSWCPGRTLMQAMRARPWNIRRLGYAFGRQQAALHRATIPHDEASDPAWITRFGPVDDALREHLLSLDLQHDRLLHLDYHPLNAMVEKNRITCILDWTNAMPGDPRADVARTWSILRLMPLSAKRTEPTTEVARRLLAAGWLRGYEREAGPLLDMEPFKIWAGVAMIADLAPKIGRPGIWLEQRHLDEIEQRVTALRRQSNLPADLSRT